MKVSSSDLDCKNGFTIIELLIVIIVIGILSALALPSFMNQARKAKQSEAKIYIGSMNRAQQTTYMESGRFTDEISALSLGIETETDSYIYRVTTSSASAFSVVNRAIPSDGTTSNTVGIDATVDAYIGGVKAGRISATATTLGTLTVLCEALKPPVSSGDNGTITEPQNFSITDSGFPTCNPLFYRETR